MRATPTSANSPASRALEVTFLLPNQDSIGGGIHVIERLAGAIAAQGGDARIVVLGGGLQRRVEGVEVLAGPLESVPERPGEILLVYADCDGGWRLALERRRSVPVLLFQGYGMPGDIRVDENLGQFGYAACVSGWLVERARVYGCEGRRIPMAVDREAFFGGPPAEQRPDSVAMLLHPLYSKGSRDGLEALRLLRGRRPQVPIDLFGAITWKHRRGIRRIGGAEGATRVHGSLPRPDVAELLRRSAVFVCSSWEEGFGMPGLEALLCGAALATTDALGTREYAFDGRTALVSPPRRPAELAANAELLLGDPRRRGELARAGSAYAREAFGSWEDAGRELAGWLATIDPERARRRLGVNPPRRRLPSSARIRRLRGSIQAAVAR